MKTMPDTFIINNTRIANILRKDCRYPFYANRKTHLVGSRCEIDVGPDIRPRTQFVIDIPADEKGIQELTYLDMIIADAIYTIYSHGKKKFTPNSILTEITGRANVSLAPDRKKRYLQSIEKLCQTTIDIYCPGENEKDPENLCSRYHGSFLSAKKIQNDTSDTGRNKVVNYQFKDDTATFVMPLYEYGVAKKQMITVSPTLLQLPFKEKKDEYIILAHYLLHELEIVRNPNNKVANRRFYPYDERKDKSYQVFGALGIDPSSLSQKNCLEKAQEIYQSMISILKKWRDTYLDDLNKEDSCYPYLTFDDDEIFFLPSEEKSKNQSSFFIEITRNHFGTSNLDE